MMAWSCDPNPALEIGIGIGLFQSWFVDMDASSDFASPSQAMGAFFWVLLVVASLWWIALLWICLICCLYELWRPLDPQQDEIDP